ncbi:MAG: hypothetical protein TREMPRED_003664 [Tremellales sp. Tagirdzhanova-0007]|nr:MAG: hypothetical protein TREMPRED_003664 [Tremellales sp. Tagirdzhanova-0007]
MFPYHPPSPSHNEPTYSRSPTISDSQRTISARSVNTDQAPNGHSLQTLSETSDQGVLTRHNVLDEHSSDSEPEDHVQRRRFVKDGEVRSDAEMDFADDECSLDEYSPTHDDDSQSAISARSGFTNDTPLNKRSLSADSSDARAQTGSKRRWTENLDKRSEYDSEKQSDTRRCIDDGSHSEKHSATDEEGKLQPEPWKDKAPTPEYKEFSPVERRRLSTPHEEGTPVTPHFFEDPPSDVSPWEERASTPEYKESSSVERRRLSTPHEEGTPSSPVDRRRLSTPPEEGTPLTPHLFEDLPLDVSHSIGGETYLSDYSSVIQGEDEASSPESSRANDTYDSNNSSSSGISSTRPLQGQAEI